MRIPFIARGLTMAALALALAACGSTNEAGPVNESSGDSTLNSVGDSKPVNEGQDAVGAAVGMGSAAMANTADAYVTNAAISDMYEIQAGKIAADRAKSPAIKQFGQQMVTDHTATTKKLKDTLLSAGVNITPPAALDARRQGMIDNLKAASADDFDKTYVDQQTAAHREAVALHSGFAEDGDNAALKKLAGETTPKIQHHLEMVQKLDAGADGTK